VIAAVSGGIRRSRHRKKVATVLLGLALIVVLAHAASSEGEMGHAAAEMGKNTAMCIAVLGGLTAVLAGLGRSLRSSWRPQTPARLIPVALPIEFSRPRPSSRDGPACLQVFRL
jgi:hypothetical protein